MEIRHHDSANAAFSNPIEYEPEYQTRAATPIDETQRLIRAEVQRLQKEYGRYLAYGLRLQIPSATRRVLLFVSSVLSGHECKLTIHGLQRVEKSLKLFRAKVEALQEQQAQIVGEKRSLAAPSSTPTDADPVSTPLQASRQLKRPRRTQPQKPTPIDTTPGLTRVDIVPTTLSPATQRVLALPGVSPSSVMKSSRVVLDDDKATQQLSAAHVDVDSAIKEAGEQPCVSFTADCSDIAQPQQPLQFGHGIIQEPIQFTVQSAP
jgi:hypothetical protein